MVAGDGSVKLCRPQFGVAEHLLDGTQVGATLEQMGCEGMAQGMGEGGDSLSDHRSDATRAQRSATQPTHSEFPAAAPASSGLP